MAPAIHPPCTPTSSCQPVPRCHPTPPECPWPVECLRNTTLLNVPPCPSAASIMAARSRTKCASCGQFGKEKPKRRNINDMRRVRYVHGYLRRKDHEALLQRHDMLTGQHMFNDYIRSRGRYKDIEDCCAGHGHRGRLIRTPFRRIRKRRFRLARRRREICAGPYSNSYRKRRCCTIL